MKSYLRAVVGIVAVVSALTAGSAFAQAPVAGVAAPPAAQAPAAGAQPKMCGQNIPAPANLPPTNIGPIFYLIGLCFPTQGEVSVVDAPTYLYYMQAQNQISLPSQQIWKPYNDATERIILEDTKRLWGTNFLDDFSVDVEDYRFSNGVIGKVVAYNLEERQRIKNINYVSAADGKPFSKEGIDRAKIEEQLRNQNITIRLDSFVDQTTESKVADVVRAMLADKGYQDSTVEPVIEQLPGGLKTVNLNFKITEGAKVKIDDVNFVGNTVFSDATLKRHMKNNKGGKWYKLGGPGDYQEDKLYDEDIPKVVNFYREHGYITVNVGEATLKKLRDSKDGKERLMVLEIPVTEGKRYRLGEVKFEGNTKVPDATLLPYFKLKKGDVYNEKKVAYDFFNKLKEIYGSGGYMEMTPLHIPEPADPNSPDKEPIVNLTIKITEGKEFFVNRITFQGNTTTRDNVIRREIRVFEGGPLNTEALKYSVRRLNQLGYFKPIDDQKNVITEKVPGEDNKVNLTLKFEEQNRNQLSFGAGVSQYDGVFAQLSFSTANFMGRGESFTTSVQTGARAHDYEVAFTEPFLFDRPITGSVDLHRRDIRYINYYTQASDGGNLTMGWPLAAFTRMYLDYSYEQVKVKDLSASFFDPSCALTLEALVSLNSTCSTVDITNLTEDQRVILQRNPFLYDSLQIGQGGKRTIGKLTPTIALNSVDNPITPTTGRRYSFSTGLAGLGGNTRYIKPSGEAVWFLRQSARTTIGLRAQSEYIRPYGQRVGETNSLPIFEKLVLGGGYSIRGYDLRSVGPTAKTIDANGNTIDSGIVIGGNKSLLFNGEYLINIAGPVRLILFYDAGQVKDTGARFTNRDFITSTGAEIRFQMPVLNVPFRLILADNAQHGNCSGFDKATNTWTGSIGTCVINYTTGHPEKKIRFRFDVGSTF